MTQFNKTRQRGLTFISMLFVGGILAAVGVVVAQIIPTVIEYQAILKAVQKSSEGSSIYEVRNIFERATAIDAISSVTAKDIEVTQENDKVRVSFYYEREIHLAGPAYLTIKYEGQSK